MQFKKALGATSDLITPSLDKAETWQPNPHNATHIVITHHLRVALSSSDARQTLPVAAVVVFGKTADVAVACNKRLPSPA